MSTPRYRRITASDWSSKLNSFGAIAEGVDDIGQCIDIILHTQKGSLPHRLDFGCELWRFIDMPLPAARPRVIQEAMRALAKWEPRAVVESVTCEAVREHVLRLTVSWHPAVTLPAEKSNYIQEVVL